MKKEISRPIAHIFALFTILVWGTTFIASKLLLQEYTPLQIMLMRFALAYLVLWILKPKTKLLGIKKELEFALLGIFGCTVYFLAENYALTMTLASNVSIIVATAPMLTALLAHHFLPDEKLHRNVFFGFFVAIAGVALVVFNGTVVLRLNPLGDLLSLGAALSWAVYSILLRRQLGKIDSIMLTRRVMLWGFLTSLPVALIDAKPFSFVPLTSPKLLFCILFLGLVGSGICYVLWNLATKRLGTVVASNYIYVNPLATMVAEVLILQVHLSWMGCIGTAMILAGVFLADHKKIKRS